MPHSHPNTNARLEHAYDRMIERVQSAMEQSKDGGGNLQQALQQARDAAVQQHELNREEAEKVSAWVARDLRDAGTYLSGTQRNLSDWLHMDLELIEYSLWDLFTKAADKTKLDLLQFQEEVAESSEYRSGEVTGPGTLECIQCGERLHFRRSGHIPPCPRCHGNVFERRSK